MIRSPNIWDTPDVYELENLAADRAGTIEAAVDALRPWHGADVLDIGCGTGFHLPRLPPVGGRGSWASSPTCPSSARARERLASLGQPASVLAGDAEALPLRDTSVDVVHARWAYFFGAGCEPGLAEVGAGAATRRHRLHRRQRRHPVDVRRLVPPRVPGIRPRCGAAVLGPTGIRDRAPDHRVDVRPARGPRGRRADRASAGHWPDVVLDRRTTGSPSTTRSSLRWQPF